MTFGASTQFVGDEATVVLWDHQPCHEVPRECRAKCDDSEGRDREPHECGVVAEVTSEPARHACDDAVVAAAGQTNI